MKSLLVALGALHSRNIIHKAISARNIVYGAQHCIKHANSSFDKWLDLLNDNEPFDLRASRVKDKETSIPIGWKSPEEQTNEFFECDEQNDIWCLGRTFLEIIYGADLAQRSRTLDDFINKQRIIY
jgi:translation initiation factor 2-alpha kinase 4